MKRVLSICAVTLIALLSAGPAGAALTCALGNPAMDASCPMGMTHMDRDCPMSRAMAMDCTQDCCNRTLPQAVSVPGIPAKSKIQVTPLSTFSPLAVQFTGTGALSEPVSVVAAASPPRYLLLRVFRI